MSPALRPAPVCQLRLWDARAPSRRSRSFQGLGKFAEPPLDRREHIENIASTEAKHMSAALGTLPFLATLWLLVVLGARVLEESGARIVAALKGVPPQPVSDLRIRCQSRVRMRLPRPANVEWRAAA